jgi:hypothetical protein
MTLPAHSGPWTLIQFRNHFSQTVGLLGRVISTSQGRYLHTGQHKHRINAYTHQISMPWVGFEPTITASGRAKTVLALDRAATVTGCWFVRFEVFTAVTMKNVVFWMWPRVDLVWANVSEESIASISRVEKSASEEPAWGGGCRLSHQSIWFELISIVNYIWIRNY